MSDMSKLSDMSQTEEDVFDLKYLEEISEFFNEFKEINNYYGLDLFRDDFNEYFEFLKQNVVIHEFPDEETLDDELIDY